MKKLDYGTMLSPSPIVLSLGTLRKPKLIEISDEIGFDNFEYFEFLIKLTPEIYFTKINKEQDYWDNLGEDQRSALILYDIVVGDERLASDFVKLLNFFFIEEVVYQNGCFAIVECKAEGEGSVKGLLIKDTFMEVVKIIQQICCIYEDDEQEDEKNIKFKKEAARKLFQKMKTANKKKAQGNKGNIDLSLSNIISAVSNHSMGINPINVWDLTVFQLNDSFNRIQSDNFYYIDMVRVAVWGDEKNKFNPSLWHKNYYDKK